MVLIPRSDYEAHTQSCGGLAPMVVLTLGSMPLTSKEDVILWRPRNQETSLRKFRKNCNEVLVHQSKHLIFLPSEAAG